VNLSKRKTFAKGENTHLQKAISPPYHNVYFARPEVSRLKMSTRRFVAATMKMEKQGIPNA
jgi:hypothetical protein